MTEPNRHTRNTTNDTSRSRSYSYSPQSSRPRAQQSNNRRPYTTNNAGRPNTFRGGHKSRNDQNSNSRSRNPYKETTPRKTRTAKEQVEIPPAGDNIRIVPLGGVEEIGRNMTAFEFRDTIIIIDAGFQFQDEETPGIDYILPNTQYLEDRKDKIKGLFITHGHLDHIGGIPYIIEKIGYPKIYTRRFGEMMIRKRQEEFPHLKPLDIHTVEEDEHITISPDIKIRTFAISHAIPDAMGIIVETPYGDVVFIEDVRVDHVNGVPTEEEIEHYKDFNKNNREVLLLTMDSTSVYRPGFSTPESVVVANLEKYIKDAPGRLFIGTFASQVERIMTIITAAQKFNKKVVVEGRSMKTNVEIIKELDLLKPENVIPVEDVNNYPDDRIIILATGAQGEEYAALMRVSNKTHKYISLKATDTVLLSSSVIPGNDYAVTKLKDNLYRSEAKIITYMDAEVHASGHGNRGELEWIHNQINYKFFMPLHGYHYMLRIHEELAQTLGVPREHIAVPDNGSIFELQEQGTKLVKLPFEAPNDPVTVDGFNIGGMQDVVLRDRQVLSEDGFIVVVVALSPKTGKLRKSPDIISRGFVYLRDSQELLTAARETIRRIVRNNTVAPHHAVNFDYLKRDITDQMRRLFLQKTGKRPLVIPVILGI